uniref:Uncharacterized protein n=1 Tax=Pristionchus pacificus TaxID=54126 RepID=A0A2A6C4H2_PRIPA|eukprot:PDM73007.1 hypothetical protein PRIPAC_39441 [Pristionchus pacificus]
MLLNSLDGRLIRMKYEAFCPLSLFLLLGSSEINAFFWMEPTCDRFEKPNDIQVCTDELNDPPTHLSPSISGSILSFSILFHATIAAAACFLYPTYGLRASFSYEKSIPTLSN